MQPQTHALIRYLGDVFLAFVVIMFVSSTPRVSKKPCVKMTSLAGSRVGLK